MNLEEFSEDIQNVCREQILYLKETLANRTENIEEILNVADAMRKWAMLWIDLEKRKFIDKGKYLSNETE